MRAGSPFDALHEALSSAVTTDLPDIEYWARDWAAYNKLSKDEKARTRAADGPGELKKRRPMTDETNVTMFIQTWGSTALGYGGMGGAAITDAYTVVVEYHGVWCVYFGCGRLAYRIDSRKQSNQGLENFRKDLGSRNLEPISKKLRYL